MSFFRKHQMFARIKKSGKNQYLQIVESKREAGKVKQRVITTLGRLDKIHKKGDIETLIRTLSRFSEKQMLILSQKSDVMAKSKTIGPVLIFERLWKETGIQEIIETLTSSRKFEFNIERAIFLTTLHRLFVSGSDRYCEKWKERYNISGAEQINLHHLYPSDGIFGRDNKRSRHIYTKTNKRFYRRRNLFNKTRFIQHSRNGILRYNEFVFLPKASHWEKEKAEKHLANMDTAKTIDQFYIK